MAERLQCTPRKRKNYGKKVNLTEESMNVKDEVYLLNLLGELDGPEPVEERADVYEIDGDEKGVPERGVEPTDDHPGPERKEGTADEQGAPQIEDAVQAARGQVRQQEEGVRQLEVDVVNVDTLIRLASESSVQKGWRHYWQVRIGGSDHRQS